MDPAGGRRQSYPGSIVQHSRHIYLTKHNERITQPCTVRTQKNNRKKQKSFIYIHCEAAAAAAKKK